MAESSALVYLLFYGYLYTVLVNADDSRCGYVIEGSRTECGHLGITKADCETQGCCWDETAVDLRRRCYNAGCPPGRFGWGCRFRCHCQGDAACDPVTGQCPNECKDDRWGVGCLLESRCIYNDNKGEMYMGKLPTTKKGYSCASWALQKHYPGSHFPEADLYAADNFCRNPKPTDDKTWCYYSFHPSRKWDYCDLSPCECAFGRYGVNCVKECHCSDTSEVCDQLTGSCKSGCDHRWTGLDCQECAPGRFGPLCLKECHCYNSADVCDSISGHCKSGCARGWTGLDCQTECADGKYGLDCIYECNCRDREEACNKENGACPVSGCWPGFSGTACQIKCHCADEKEVCDPENGLCKSGCAHGWVGPGCLIGIPELVKPPQVMTRDATSVRLRWNTWDRNKDKGDGPIGGYYVYYRSLNNTEAWHKERVDSEEGLHQEATIRGLDENTFYSFAVAPIHGDAFEGYRGPDVRQATCGKPYFGPNKLRVNARRQSRTTMEANEFGELEDETSQHHPNHLLLEVQWEVPPQTAWGCDRLQSFRLYRKGPGDKQFSFWKTANITRTVVGKVDRFSNYSVGVTMVNNAQRESDMTVGTFVGQASAVRDLRIGETTATSLLLRWQAPQQTNGKVNHYIIRYREMAISDCDLETLSWGPLITINASQTSYNITGLNPYSKYQYRVRAATDMGKGQATTHIATTQALVPQMKVRRLVQLSLNAIAVRYHWDAIECENRLGNTVGYRYELRETEEDMIIDQKRVPNTDVTINNLVPYTQYAFRVRFVNHVGEGPWSHPEEFRTLAGRPPAPRNLNVLVRTSQSLTVTWEPPRPAHGVLTGYEVKYWSRHTLGNPNTGKVSARHLEFNMSSLPANTSFGIQVRAFTEVGPGPWGEVKYGFTDEAPPGVPDGFKNVSRTTTSLSFVWNAPKTHNGILREYKIQCVPIDYLGQTIGTVRGRNGVVKARQESFTVSDLEPGTCYLCSLQASTSKGFGEPVKERFWTLPKKPLPPEPPIVESDKSTDTSIAVRLKPTVGVPQQSAVTNSINQVVVERRSGVAESRVRREPDTPCNVTHSRLYDHDTARKLKLTCYVAARLAVKEEQVFVVGDNRTYMGFYNAPLETRQEYDVWYGVIVNVDGMTAASYSKSDTPALPFKSIPPPPTEATMIIAGVGVAAMVAVVCLIILVAVLIARRRRSSRKERMELIIANKSPMDQMDGIPTRPPRKCDSNGLGTLKQGMLPDVCNGSVNDLTLADQAETEPLYGNTDAESSHAPISVENLWNFVKEKKNSKVDSFRQEYEELPMGLRAKCEIARKPENKVKNRYGNIVAYDHSRVMLNCLPNDPHSDYINADYIDGYCKPSAFIATQGPSKHTLNDIWRMAWQMNTRRIVMVTNLVEDGRGEAWPTTPNDTPIFYHGTTLRQEHKCEHYWPDGEPRLYGDIWVEMIKQEQLADFTMRTFHLTKDGETKTLRQFHFTAWPDHGVPAYATSLLSFRKKVRSFDDPSSGPTIVHCSAGVGRTGTFIALDYLLDQAKVEGQVDVFNCVQVMRTKRVNMIQTQEQYVFVYDALLEALKCGDTSIPCVDFRRRYLDMNTKVSQDTGKVRLEEEFELLGIMSPPLDTTTCRDALDHENIHKNRYTHIIPIDDMSRAYLSTYTPGSTDYINAVFVDGYRQRDAFIVTQMPLPQTIMDFWVMVFDHGCKTIIMMNELDTKDDTCACYWPEGNEPYECGPILVELKDTDNSRNDIIIRDFVITMRRKGKQDSEPQTVRQFQFLGWPRDLPVPANKSSVITLINLVEKWQQWSGNHVITVHCMDGATQSGVFCSTSYMLERLKVEQEVDVFQSTKHIRINRPHFVPNMDQYRFLYDMAIEYMDCFDAYANFK